MNKPEIHDMVVEFVKNDKSNYIGEDIAIRPDLVGLKIYDEPIMAVGDVADPLFLELREPKAVGGHHFLPEDWLRDAKSVISIFLPYTRRIKDANAAISGYPADEWLHGRVEGQQLIAKLCAHVVKQINESGAIAVSPLLDERFWAKEGPRPGDPDTRCFTSNWSERHVAYICGLGTFSLSKALITEKGVAGRLCSLVTNLELLVSERTYEGLYDRCIMCGACVEPCPVGAISLEDGKDHYACDKYMEETKVKYAPRYGCGKCQAGMPCESMVP